MTLHEIYERLRAIDEAKDDYEVAHGMEDQLWLDVLCDIAARGDAFAGLAIKSRDIKFPRYCA